MFFLIGERVALDSCKLIYLQSHLMQFLSNIWVKILFIKMLNNKALRSHCNDVVLYFLDDAFYVLSISNID